MHDEEEAKETERGSSSSRDTTSTRTKATESIGTDTNTPAESLGTKTTESPLGTAPGRAYLS